MKSTIDVEKKKNMEGKEEVEDRGEGGWEKKRVGGWKEEYNNV